MYGLVYNNSIVVGPRAWSYSFFLDFLEEEGLDSSLLPNLDPKQPVYGPDWKILPVTQLDQPPYNHLFEQYAGPYWTIHSDHITGSYNVVPQTLSLSQSKLRELITNTRYRIETGGVLFTFADNTEVTVYTSREDRGVYIDAYQVMPDTPGATIVFKFPNSIFRAVTKPELAQIIGAGVTHIQQAFDWESSKYAEIDQATTIAELQAIELRHPSEIPSEP